MEEEALLRGLRSFRMSGSPSLTAASRANAGALTTAAPAEARPGAEGA